ncbi:hypothetical protein NXF25_016109 [Crotalus adamanteus]|uniref:L27 domain-containing protein n=1 Tax=Crotalus adamanteus TaxID=8729 RepID=A0AAW1AX04_CROAD
MSGYLFLEQGCRGENLRLCPVTQPFLAAPEAEHGLAVKSPFGGKRPFAGRGRDRGRGLEPPPGDLKEAELAQGKSLGDPPKRVRDARTRGRSLDQPPRLPACRLLRGFGRLWGSKPSRGCCRPRPECGVSSPQDREGERPSGWKPLPAAASRAARPGPALARLPPGDAQPGSMSTRTDTQRAVAILARYRGILQSPAEQPLRASVEKVVRVFQSELFQALLDIQECYELSVLSTCQQDGSAHLGPGGPSKIHDAADPGGQEGQPLQERATGGPDVEPVPQLVRVTQSRTELPAHVCSLVVGVSNILPKQPSCRLRGARLAAGMAEETFGGIGGLQSHVGSARSSILSLWLQRLVALAGSSGQQQGRPALYPRKMERDFWGQAWGRGGPPGFLSASPPAARGVQAAEHQDFSRLGILRPGRKVKGNRQEILERQGLPLRAVPDSGRPTWQGEGQGGRGRGEARAASPADPPPVRCAGGLPLRL